MVTFHDIIRGLQILEKHEAREDRSEAISAEPGVIYAGQHGPGRVGYVDREDLARLGWRWDEGRRAWGREVNA